MRQDSIPATCCNRSWRLRRRGGLRDLRADRSRLVELRHRRDLLDHARLDRRQPPLHGQDAAYTVGATPAIELAPPAVGGAAYLQLHGAVADPIAYVLAGYTGLMVLVQLRLIPLYARTPFSPVSGLSPSPGARPRDWRSAGWRSRTQATRHLGQPSSPQPPACSSSRSRSARSSS